MTVQKPIPLGARLRPLPFMAAIAISIVFVRNSQVGAQAITPKEQKHVDDAIERAVAYLRRTQMKTGSWTDGAIVTNEKVGFTGNPRLWAVGYAALPALALLESGLPPADAAVQQAARFVRFHGPALIRTYEIALAILLLDRLGEPTDRALIRSLGLRLAAGQTHLGGWGYNCPLLNEAQEKKLRAILQAKNREEIPAKLVPPAARTPAEKADNSNTQFAILGLWVTRKYDLPVEYTLALAEHRFRLALAADGWEYNWWLGRSGRSYGSMTCAGLLALAAGRGSAPEGFGKKEGPKAEDEGLFWALRALGAHLNDPSDKRMAQLSVAESKTALNLYFLWSVERVGVLCDLQTIGGRDWYRWGVELLLPTQQRDGSWVGRGSGGYPPIDTSFALLFLKRSDLLPDLRETLQKRLKITDPGLDGKGVTPKTSPGEKTEPKSDGRKTSPGEKRVSPRSKETSRQSGRMVRGHAAALYADCRKMESRSDIWV